MKLCKVVVPATVLCQIVLLSIVLGPSNTRAAPQEPSFELPVQLVGFPTIILAVRLSNFVKKLAYSLNPNTYMARSKRAAIGTESQDFIDIIEAEKRLVAELGENVCIYPRICLHYAHLSSPQHNLDLVNLDWNNILSQYKSSPDRNKEFYLLSVFLGDIVGSPKFCNQLVKRGRACTP